ncbi:Tctex-1 family-domain-containing protein [Paraphysoderma sedebokerense]|nr:Tctex-1 family-domain-containing protein [Paraphysoderma sedebokerense]
MSSGSRTDLNSKSNLTSSKTNLLSSKSNLTSNKSSHSSKSELTKSKNISSKANIVGLSAVPGSAGANVVKPNNTSGAVDASMLEKAAETGQRIYENTYKMKPDKKFPTEAVRRLTEDILKKGLQNVSYSAEKVPELTKSLSNQILQAVKKLEIPRYKLVAEVSIGEFKGQGIRVASRCVWDPNTDSYTSASYKNSTLFAVAIVFGAYFE